MPETETRKETTESVKSMGESKTNKCNHVMTLKNESTVDKKGGVQVSCVPCMFSYQKSAKDLNIEKKPGGDLAIETNEHLMNVSFNRDTS